MIGMLMSVFLVMETEGMDCQKHWVDCVHFDDNKTSTYLPCHKGGKYINACKSVLSKCHVYKSKICK